MERGQHAYTRQIDVGVESRPGGAGPCGGGWERVGVADLWDGAAAFGAARARPAGVMPSPCTFALRAYTPEKFIRPLDGAAQNW